MTRDTSVYDLSEGEPLIRRRRYGVIEVREGRFHRIRFRPWPKIVSMPEVWWDASPGRKATGDCCRLYYNQPVGSSNFLALKYVVSTLGTRFSTCRRALLVLDEVARIKETDAIVCEAFNRRISDRLLNRWGWEAHFPTSRRRHFIKRFYGNYPPSRREELASEAMSSIRPPSMTNDY